MHGTNAIKLGKHCESIKTGMAADEAARSDSFHLWSISESSSAAMVR
jgi:hypothetical protein